MSEKTEPTKTRRDVLKEGLRGAALVGIGALGLKSLMAANQDTAEGTKAGDEMVWQIDPYKCTWCGKCESACVLTPSVVKCMRDIPICGYCEICTGYQHPERLEDNEAAENQICPTQAISRTHIEDVYYEYNVDPKKCIGCAKCCEGCTTFGNGSMYLQVFQDRCLNCAVCTIAKACPAKAFVRAPAKKPYLVKSKAKGHGKPEATA